MSAAFTDHLTLRDVGPQQLLVDVHGGVKKGVFILFSVLIDGNMNVPFFFRRSFSGLRSYFQQSAGRPHHRSHCAVYCF